MIDIIMRKDLSVSIQEKKMKPHKCELDHLRVGDRVIFEMSIYPEGHPARGPSEVTITGVQQSVVGKWVSKLGCKISWDRKALTHSPFGWQCDGSDVIQIISRGPYKADPNYRRNLYSFMDDVYKRYELVLGGQKYVTVFRIWRRLL